VRPYLPTVLVLLFTSQPAAAQISADAGDTARSDESFVHESWTVRDGLPVNSVNGLLQGRDGYIWIATFDGLVRFEGVRFTIFNTATSPGLPSNRIITLQEARDGTLWLRTEDNQLIRSATDASRRSAAIEESRQLSGKSSKTEQVRSGSGPFSQTVSGAIP